MLALYLRAGCGLCEDFLLCLRPWAAARGVSLDCIDIDTDASLREIYGWEVPVLCAGATEICRHYFDAQQLEAWWRGQPARPGPATS
jgi:hypothetical protein